MNIAFIGLGVMGYPMAGHLAKAGHELSVYNRTTAKAEHWANEFGGQAAATPALAAKNAHLVMTCVGNDDDVRSVVFGTDGVLDAMAVGATLIDHTTTSAELARELSNAAQQRELCFLDAPVSGGQAGAENGTLTIMVGGETAVYDHVEPVLQAYAKKSALMGHAGSGQLSKMVNQICIAGLVQGLAEGLNFAELAGLEGAKVVDVISKGAAQSWQMENRYQTMLAGDYDHGFAVEWMRKDLAYAIDEAHKRQAEVPVTELVNQFYGEVESIGGRRWDTSSLLMRLHSRRD